MTDEHLDIGSIIYISVKPIFKIYIIMITGFFLARKNILTVDTSRNISALAITVLLPCLVFNSIVTNIQNSDIAEIGTIVLVSTTFMLMGGLFALIIALTTGCPKTWLGGAMTVGLFPNLSDLPIAYIQSLESTGVFTADQVSKGTAYICISVAVELVLQFNCGGYRLNGWDFRYAIRKAQNEIDTSNGSLKKLNSSNTTTDEEAIIGNATTSNSSSNSNNNNNNNNDTLNDVNRRNSEDAMSTISSLDDDDDDERDIPLHDLNKKEEEKEEEEEAHMNFIRQRTSRTTTATGRRLSIRTAGSAEEDLRRLPSQNMNDVVKVYSRFDDLAQGDSRPVENLGDLTVKKVISTNSNKNNENNINDIDIDDNELSIFQEMIIEIKKTFTNITIQKIGNSIWSLIKMIITSSFRPLSMTAIIAITISMIPWVKAIFVKNNQVTLPSAPDSEPPLSFIMDTVSYLGQAQVPIGLLMLGATISRIELNKLPKGAWKTPTALVIMRFCLFPIIGVSINAKLAKAGLFYDDLILQFVCNLDWCTPPATALLYLTAFYTPMGSEDHTQMDCLALTYTMSYIILVIALPFTVTYTLVHQLGI